MFKMTKEEINRCLALEYKSAFDDMLTHHVRPEKRVYFLLSMLKTTNEYASSTVWGTVWDILIEDYDYTEKELRMFLESKESF